MDNSNAHFWACLQAVFVRYIFSPLKGSYRVYAESFRRQPLCSSNVIDLNLLVQIVQLNQTTIQELSEFSEGYSHHLE